LALVNPSFDQDGKYLHLDFHNLPTLKIPLGVEEQRNEPIVIDIGIWKDMTRGVDEGDEVAAWFQKVAQYSEPVRLLRLVGDHNRTVPTKYVQEDMKIENQLVSYADGFPFLLASMESLALLNSKIPSSVKPLPMRRFRPNFIVAGLDDAFDEDSWSKIRIGDTVFRVVKHCTRCKVTTVDPEEGEFAGEEPIKTLKTFRKGLLEGKDEVCFGQNLIHETYGSIVSLGQRVEIVT